MIQLCREQNEETPDGAGAGPETVNLDDVIDSRDRPPDRTPSGGQRAGWQVLGVAMTFLLGMVVAGPLSRPAETNAVQAAPYAPLANNRAAAFSMENKCRVDDVAVNLQASPAIPATTLLVFTTHRQCALNVSVRLRARIEGHHVVERSAWRYSASAVDPQTSVTLVLGDLGPDECQAWRLYDINVILTSMPESQLPVADRCQR